jgi:HK97 family phage prohead protease
MTNAFDYKFDLIKSEALGQGFIKGIATTPKVDSYDDIIAPGAFLQSITERGVTGPRGIKMLAQHNSDMPIGNWTKLEYDGEKLLVEGQLDLNDKHGQEYHRHVKTDKVGSLSVGFRTQERTYNEDTYVRTITKGDLREISLVTFPANEDAVITEVKSEDSIPRLSALEKKIAQEFGLSRKQACGLIRVIKSSGLFASAPVVPATTGVIIPVKDDIKTSELEMLKIINSIKSDAHAREIARLIKSF